MSDYPVETLFGDHLRLIPVLHVDNPDHAEPLLEALVGGGITIIEVTLRSDCALEVIERMIKVNSDAIIGAGTVTRADQLNGVVDSGAKFGVSPALTPDFAKAIKSSGLPFLPGTSTPSEVQFALEQGFQELKFFPADLFGGMAYLTHLRPIYEAVRFCPTGGISDANSADYLALENVLAVGGAFLAQRDMIAAAKWDEIRATAARSVAAASAS